MSRKFKLVFFLQDMDDEPPRSSIFEEDKKQVVIELRDEDVVAASLAARREDVLNSMKQKTEEEKRLWLLAFAEREKSRAYLGELLMAACDLVARSCHAEIDNYLAKKEKAVASTSV